MPESFVPPDQRVQSGGVPVQLGPVGFWLDTAGRVAATDPTGKSQVTPGQQGTPESQMTYDPAKDLFYNVVNGQKHYQSPYAYAGAEGVNSLAKGTGKGMLQTMNKGGGAFHGSPTWNATKGAFDVKLDWGKIGSLIVGGALTAGALDAALGAGTAATAATSTGAGVGPGGTAAAGTGVGVGGASTGAGVGAAASTVPAVIPPAVHAATTTSSWLGPLLKTALPVAGGVLSSVIQAKAQGKATEAQQHALAEALAYEKQRDTYATATEANRYAGLTSTVAPYVATGSAADAKMAQVLGLPAPPPSAPTPSPPTYPTPPLPGSPGNTTPPSALTPLVSMQAPNGTTKHVPATEEAHWTTKGARRVA